MTIKELKAAIKDLPDHMDVYIHNINEEDSSYCFIDCGEVIKAKFYEDTDGHVAEADVFILMHE